MFKHLKMEKNKRFKQKTLSGIMVLVLLFLIVDIAVFVLMIFNVDLNKTLNQITDNNKFDNVSITTTDNQTNTDNTSIKVSPTLKITTTPKITTDNIAN